MPGESVLAEVAGSLGAGAGIVKDYVKSRKHEWDSACYVPDLRDTPALRRIVERFVELQGESLAGGVVARAVSALGCRFVTTDLARRRTASGG
ncbi:ATP-grasp domain-containing protein [Nocardia sp. NPDC004415]